MIDESLLKKHNIGRDGFVWWLGQVCSAYTWNKNYPDIAVSDTDELPGFKRRVKVAILGYHTPDKNELKDDELPWAYCLMPVTAGGGAGGTSESLNLSGGEWVFGFFLDGEDGQQPVIIGCLDKASQNDFPKEITENRRYLPTSGYTNNSTEPLTSQKKDDQVGRIPTGPADVSVGQSQGGNQVPQVTRTITNEAVAIEQPGGLGIEYRPKASQTRKDNAVATGDMQVADPSENNDPLAVVDKTMRRMSRLTSITESYNNIYVNESLNQMFDMEAEQERAGRIITCALKTIQDKARGATLEASSASASNMAKFTPLSRMPAAKDAIDETQQNIANQFNSIIDGLPAQASSFVSQTAGRIANQPPCVTQDYVGGLLGNTLGQVDNAINSLMGPISSLSSSLSSAAGLFSNLSSLGGISINMDGIQRFTTSYSRLIQGEQALPAPRITDLNILDGGEGEPPPGTSMSAVMDVVAAAQGAAATLSSTVTQFTSTNSVFSTAMDLDNLRIGSLGGLGRVTTTLRAATAPSGISPTTWSSIIANSRSVLEGGETLDVAIVAANTIQPGAGTALRALFSSSGNTSAGRGCSTGPSANGPPILDVYGGSGTGCVGNIVVGASGQVLAVAMAQPNLDYDVNGNLVGAGSTLSVPRYGQGYTQAPYIAVSDSSGQGSGAVARAHLREADRDLDGPGGPRGSCSIERIEIVESGTGYIARPDGSVGGNGRLIARRSDTVYKDADGNFRTLTPGMGAKLPPGTTVWFPHGTQVELPTSTTVTDTGELLRDVNKVTGSDPRARSIVGGSTAHGYIDFRRIRLMHDYDHDNNTRIIPGPQGADTSVGDNGFGEGDDLPRALEQGYTPADIRYYLEGVPSLGIQSYFLTHRRGLIGRHMQEWYLDNPNWGRLPVVLSDGRRPGKIKSLQVVLSDGYKGFTKVTDASRVGAGKIFSLRDAVTDRKISNLLEFQTGNWINIVDRGGPDNSQIMDMFNRQQDAPEIAGITDLHGRFGSASIRSWAQTRATLAEGDPSGRLPGAGRRYNVLGEHWQTLDPWRAGLEAGTEVRFRGCYNHNQGLTPEQLKNPYDLTLNQYRYFIYDYVCEVYTTETGYGYALGMDPVKTTWYKLKRIEFVTGTEDWFNGEVVYKRSTDKAGRLFEMSIKVCTDDTDTVLGTGAGLDSTSEKIEIVRTALPCDPTPHITEDQHARYQPVRWYRGFRDDGTPRFNVQQGHIVGSEKHELARQLVYIYNNFGNREYIRQYKDRYELDWDVAANLGHRKYVDQGGMNSWCRNYLQALERCYKRGTTCDSTTRTIPARNVTGYGGVGVYLDLRQVSGAQTVVLSQNCDNSGVNHTIDIPGLGSFPEDAGPWTNTVAGGRIYGPISAPMGDIYLGNEWNRGISKKNDLGQQFRNNRNIVAEELGDDFDDYGLTTNVGNFVRFRSNPNRPARTVRTRVPIPAADRLTEEQYNNYRNNLDQEPYSYAFDCLRRNVLRTLNTPSALSHHGPITREETYCEFSREFVDDARKIWEPTDTRAFYLPCGAEITAPEPTDPPPPPPGVPELITVDQVKIDHTGSGYGPDDGINIGGIPVDFETDPSGRIIRVTPPDIIVSDYPEIEINSKYGAGAQLSCTLKVDTTRDPELYPADIIEVVDCVGKNIFLVES